MFKQIKTFALILIVFLNYNITHAQRAEILLISAEEVNNKLIVTYEIVNYKPEEVFNIELVVLSASGKKLNVKSVKGAIGKGIIGGYEKKIEWDLAKDNVYLDENVEIKISAEPYINLGYYNYGSLMLSSTLLPGLGLSKIDRGKPYWLMLVVGYGSVAASLVSLQLTKTNYDNYLNEMDLTKRAEYHDLSVQYDKTTKIFVATAIGTWLINYAWLTIKWNRSYTGSDVGMYKSSRLKFYANYDNKLKSTFVTLNYRF